MGTGSSRVNRRVIFPLWGLSSCKPQDPKTSLYYPGAVLYSPTRECHTSPCSHEQNRSSKTEVSIHNQALTNPTVPTTSTIVPATTAPPRANGKRLRTSQSRTDCSNTPRWERSITSSFASAIMYHHANLNRQAHAMKRKPVTCILGSSTETTSKPTGQTLAHYRFISYFRFNARFVTLLSRILRSFCSRYLGASA